MKRITLRSDRVKMNSFKIDHSTGLVMDVSIVAKVWYEMLVRPKDTVMRAAMAAFQIASIMIERDTEVSVRLSTDEEVQVLNRIHRKKDQPTNVLAFPAFDSDDLDRLPAGAPVCLGDIIIAFETATFEAEVEGKNLKDHLSHLVVHGMLHLLGHDHETENKAMIMEGLEVDALNQLGIGNPYPSDKQWVSWS